MKKLKLFLILQLVIICFAKYNCFAQPVADGSKRISSYVKENGEYVKFSTGVKKIDRFGSYSISFNGEIAAIAKGRLQGDSGTTVFVYNKNGKAIIKYRVNCYYGSLVVSDDGRVVIYGSEYPQVGSLNLGPIKIDFYDSHGNLVNRNGPLLSVNSARVVFLPNGNLILLMSQFNPKSNKKYPDSVLLAFDNNFQKSGEYLFDGLVADFKIDTHLNRVLIRKVTHNSDLSLKTDETNIFDLNAHFIGKREGWVK